jgi:hypothetical protein
MQGSCKVVSTNAMVIIWRTGCQAPLILYLVSRRRLVVRFMIRLLCCRGKLTTVWASDPAWAFEILDFFVTTRKNVRPINLINLLNTKRRLLYLTLILLMWNIG